MSREEFLERVAALRTEFDGLLDDEALGLLVLDELGLNEGAFVKLDELRGRSEASVRVDVLRIEPPREFAREGRAAGRVCNVIVRDGTAEARIVLWDRDVDKAEDGTLRAGACVTLINARVKDDARYGPELHVTPWSRIDVEGELDPAKRKLLLDVIPEGDSLALALAVESDVKPRAMTMDAPGPLRGIVRALSPTRPFRRAEGAVGFVADLDVEVGSEGVVRVVCWDEAVKAARGFAEGDPILIEDLVAKPRGQWVEWHTTKESTLKAPKTRDLD